MRTLDGQTALVTGAASGIGAAIAARFSKEGASVVGLDLLPSSGCARSLVVDLRSDDEVAAAATKVRESLKPLTIVVHAAAASVPGGVLQTTPATFLDLYDVNVGGAVRLMHAFVPQMRQAGGGSFILLSSINARFATPTLAAYAASKGGLEALTRTAAVEFAEWDIRVNAIAPASIDTPLLRSSFVSAADPEEAARANMRRHPIARFGRSDEVADLAVFLASASSGWMTGAIYPIDGGASATRRD